MNLEPWQGLLGIVLTVAGTYGGVRLTTRATREQSTASTGAEIIGQLRQQIDEQHRRFAEDLAANRTEHDRQMTAIRTEHEKQRSELEEIVSEARADRRILQDYVSALRRQIDNGDAPPPLPWPEGLSK